MGSKLHRFQKFLFQEPAEIILVSDIISRDKSYPEMGSCDIVELLRTPQDACLR